MALPRDLRSIMALARRYNASDIHIVAKLPPLLRINGDIILADYPPLQPEDTKRLCYCLMNDEQKAIFEKDWQLCCSVLDDEFGRFRVSIYNQNSNPEMSIRPVTDHIKTREDLRLPEQIEELTRYAGGLVLVTGPTGSGKTTTLNYMIDLINSERRCKIITIEDPIEYIHSRKKAIIVQQEVHTDVKTFSKALIHVLRQDPDVICVGEMRDLDTTATALTAAETGHLVIATCHTPNAYQTIERIVSIFPDNQQSQIVTQLANCLRGVIAQRLVPSSDKKSVILATELILIDAPARKHIRDKEFHQLINVIQTGRRRGMHSMDDTLIELYQNGEISYDTCLNNAQNPTSLREKIHK
ncbi:MAG: type IV pilus twitching motility protein PilT [Sedimentisphaeraceae bacterium JB056]